MILGFIGPPGAATTTAIGAAAVKVALLPAGESASNTWTGRAWARSMPCRSSPARTRRASVSGADRMVRVPLPELAPCAPAAPATAPSRPGSLTPAASKALSSHCWRPSGSMISMRSPGLSASAVAPPPVTRYRSVPGSSNHSPGSSTRGKTALMVIVGGGRGRDSGEHVP